MITLGLVSAVANGLVPYVTGRFFDSLVNIKTEANTLGAFDLPLWAGFLILWTVVQFVANNVDWINDRLKRKVSVALQFKIPTDGFIHMFKLPVAYHKSGHIQGELHKINMASWRVGNIFENIVSIAPQLLSICIGIILAASINILLAGILLIGVVVYVILLVKILRPIANIDSSAHKVWVDSWDNAAEAVQHIDSVKQNAAEEFQTKKVIETIMVKAKGLWSKLENIWSNVGFFQRTIVFLTQLAIFIISAQYVASGIITVGELVALNGYSMMFFGPFVTLGYSWQTIRNGIISTAHAEEVFSQKEEIYKPVGALYPEITGEISFKDVSFRYGDDQRYILNDINLDIKPGEVVALVGESGVGKSTIISLISGYYFPTLGHLKINGVDTNKLDLTYLRQHIGVVPQEVALFNETIETNIKYGTFDSSRESVVRVAKEVNIDEFISNLPNGYDTIVGERGVKLSVGQKQRVAIARAMLRDPKILILDEPTSALDAQTEQIVTQAIEKLMTGKTTFIIAHRLSTVRKANKILVFEKGKIVEIGTHQELLNIKDGVYRKLYEYQIGLH